MHQHSQVDKQGTPATTLLIAATICAAAAILVWRTLSQGPGRSTQAMDGEQIVFQGKDARYWHAECSAVDRAAKRSAQLVLREAGSDAVPVLKFLLGSDDESVRQQAEQSLGALGPTVVPEIVALLKNDNVYVRMHAARILAALQPHDEKTVLALARALDDREDRVVADAAFALANLREHAAPAVPALSNALRHPHELIRITAAEALAAIGPAAASAVTMLVETLDDSHDSARRSAVQAIGRIGPPAALVAVDRLIALLDTNEPYTRVAAVTALGRMGPPARAALPELKRLQEGAAHLTEVRWAIEQIADDRQLTKTSEIAALPAAELTMPTRPEVPSGSWPMLAGTPSRNAVVAAAVPTDWDLESGKHVLWQVPLGKVSFAGPAVAGGHVFIGTDNGRQRNPAHLGQQGVLAAFSAEDGQFLWQDAAPLIEDRGLGSVLQEYTTSTPLIEGDRLYYVTSQAQVRCLDVAGFADGENDGPNISETATGSIDADRIWELDLGAALGVYPHEAPNCSLVSVGPLLMVCTSNGVDIAHTGIPAPRAPSFVGIDKHSGSVVWQVVGPSPRVLHGQWSSPAVGQVGDRLMVFFGGGDGWLYALDPATGRELWRYDGNPKDAIWRPASDSGEAVRRNNIIACPVVHKQHVLLALGQDPAHGDGQGWIHRIRCDGADDVTSTHTAWQNGDIHRTIATPIVHEDLVYVGDNYGEVHCLDLETGESVWMHDQMGRIWGSMVIAGGALYVGDEDGKLTIYRTGREKEIIREIQFPASLYSMPAVANDTLYLATSRILYAIKAGARRSRADGH